MCPSAFTRSCALMLGSPTCYLFVSRVTLPCCRKQS